MREILFKAKRTDNGEWVEGYYCKFYGNGDEEPNYIIFTIYEDEKRSQPYSIQPNTLCQYTGLTDKDGKKIWENDILSCKKRGVAFEGCKVVWDNHYADWRVEPLNFGFLVPIVYDEEEPKICAWNYKKVGNIFDNPELLKDGDEA